MISLDVLGRKSRKHSYVKPRIVESKALTVARNYAGEISMNRVISMRELDTEISMTLKNPLNITKRLEIPLNAVDW